MTKKEKKMAVLHQLSQESEPISLAQLLKKMGTGYIERSVRRWLSELINEGLIEKKGNKKASRYQVIHKSSRESGKSPSCFSPESIKIIEKVKRPIYERVPIAYNEEWFETYKPNVTFYIPLNKRLQLEKAGLRSKREDPAGTYAGQIFNRLLIDLSYNSSRLEGNTYSLLDTERLLLEGSTAEGKLDEEKIMILNHKEAIRYLVDNAAKLTLSEQTICTVHYLLSDSLIEHRYAGKVRDHGVRIGGSTYIPFEDKKTLQNRLNLIVEKAAKIENPFEQSLFLLIHLSYLQAFSDVNKRTARLSANIPLIQANLVPLSFNDIEKEDYASAIISIYELQDIRPILDLYLFSYMRACAMYDSTIKAMGFDEVRVRYRQQRRTLIRDIILNKLVGASMQKYIDQQANKLIKNEDRALFIDDTREDLHEIDLSRIAGLGITPEELSEWLSLKKSV